MMEWTNKNVRTASERSQNILESGECDRSPLFVFERQNSGSGVTGGVTKWGYIFAKVGLHFWGFHMQITWGGK